MQLVIADTGPVNYLVLIGHVDLLPALFERVLLPATVLGELTSRRAPASVQTWIASMPAWLEVRETPPGLPDDPSLHGIDAGEKAAIVLAASLRADLLLMDDRRAVHAARAKGLLVTGTLGVLDLAAERGLVDFDQAIRRLDGTNFRRPQALVEALLRKHGSGKL